MKEQHTVFTIEELNILFQCLVWQHGGMGADKKYLELQQKILNLISLLKKKE
jgi:hypothetical protein